MSEFSNIKPIKFQAIREDETDAIEKIDNLFRSSRGKSTNKLGGDYSAPKQILDTSALVKNFSLEFSYPAVIFDRVCFSIDKNKRDSNILLNCTNRIKETFGLAESREIQRINILKSISLNVPYGSIFGLLGPSSCGKTTLLRCLVGLLKPDSGSIRLFGHETELNASETNSSCVKLLFGRNTKTLRSPACKVPGPNVGYMPQDLGLYEDFSIRQLLTMFGRYMKMQSQLIATRIEFMASFLDLPDVDRQIISLSGGQKRRVSFAIACLHMPPLIILDEPTVGVDPLLRQSIWKYLRRLANEENRTIIITTHYIEEAAQADQVALMRAGEILVQDSPNRIMEANNCNSLEKAFLKICNGVKDNQIETDRNNSIHQLKLFPQPRFNWYNNPTTKLEASDRMPKWKLEMKPNQELAMRHRTKKLEKLDDGSGSSSTLRTGERIHKSRVTNTIAIQPTLDKNLSEFTSVRGREKSKWESKIYVKDKPDSCEGDVSPTIPGELPYRSKNRVNQDSEFARYYRTKIKRFLILLSALLYKNYRRNINSIPLLVFQFILPMIQMISFSLCVGGRPMDIGLGVINHERLTGGSQPLVDLLVANPGFEPLSANDTMMMNETATLIDHSLSTDFSEEALLGKRYLSFIDTSMIQVINYDDLQSALADVRTSRLWAAMEIGANFTGTLLRRFDLENFYQLDSETLQQSVIKLYPDRSNKVLDMICHRSLVNSYRKFILEQFEHFRKLPIELKEPIFDIKPNLISNSIDGYTESIAAGLLASLTYIMAAGLTTFIMVVERSAGILERTYTSGVNPVAYLLVHALFRSFVMMIQIAAVMFLTFTILQQPLVGSIWLAYLILITLNLTGISYGLLISSLVSNQNGAALTIVSSLVVKITLSGILWPFEAIPRWLRLICYIQPMTMPVQALKSITLKGAGITDRTVQLGFLVSIGWLLVFLIISARRFKFYQH